MSPCSLPHNLHGLIMDRPAPPGNRNVQARGSNTNTGDMMIVFLSLMAGSFGGLFELIFFCYPLSFHFRVLPDISFSSAVMHQNILQLL